MSFDNGFQVSKQTLDRRFSDKVCCEKDDVVALVEIKVQDANVIEMDNLVIPRMELAIVSAFSSLLRNSNRAVFDPDDRVFSGNTEGLHINASSILKSNTNLYQTNETRAIFNEELGNLMLRESGFDRQIHTLWHSCESFGQSLSKKKSPQDTQ